MTISAPFPSRAGTDGRCHKCGEALLVGCSINNVGWLVSRDDLSCDLASSVEFVPQVTPMRFPSRIETVSQVSAGRIEAVSQVSAGRSYHPWEGYVIQATPSTDAVINVVASTRVLDADGELRASLFGTLRLSVLEYSSIFVLMWSLEGVPSRAHVCVHPTNDVLKRSPEGVPSKAHVCVHFRE